MNDEISLMMLEILRTDENVRNEVRKICSASMQKSEVINSQDDKDEEIKRLRRKLMKTEQQKIESETALNEKNAEIERLEKEYREKIEEYEKQIREKEELIQLHKIKIKEIERKHTEIATECNSLKIRYSDFDGVYEKYLSLGGEIIRKLERILNKPDGISDSPGIFMAYGMQENNIVALWESIATNFEYYDSFGKTQDLVDIFYYFLNLYKQVTFKEVWVDCPGIGDNYDERYHTRTSSSSAVGRIEQVILPGIQIGRNVEKKSLVVVK